MLSCGADRHPLEAPEIERGLVALGGARCVPIEQAHSCGHVAEAELRALGPALLRAVAIVWTDPAKLDALKRDPRQFFGAHCDYEVPAGLEVVVHEAREQASPDDGERVLRELEGAGHLAGSQLTLRVPPPPMLEEQPVALAEFASASMILATCTPC